MYKTGAEVGWGDKDKNEEVQYMTCNEKCWGTGGDTVTLCAHSISISISSRVNIWYASARGHDAVASWSRQETGPGV